jgi:hypothetical protein
MIATFVRLDGSSFPHPLKGLPGEALSHVVPDQIILAGEHGGTYRFTPSDSGSPVYTEVEQEGLD